jgi:predicted RNase H-like nuclease (RuvC/YqgF family)
MQNRIDLMVEIEVLKEVVEQQDKSIESLKDYAYSLENRIHEMEHYITNLKGELSILYNSIDGMHTK